MPLETPTSTVLVRLALLATLATSGCEGRTTTPPPGTEPILRTYTVPQGQADAALQALARAVAGGPSPGKVERLPDGRVMVVAPAGIHDGVAELLRGFTAAPVRSAELDYWVVLGEPASAQAGVDEVPDIAPTLRDIVASQGAMKFTLLETSRLSSMLDESANAQGSRVQVRQMISEVGGDLVADVSIDLRVEHDGNVHYRNFHSRVKFRPGQLLVLGQSGYGSELGAGEPGRRSTVYYILRGAVKTGE